MSEHCGNCKDSWFLANCRDCSNCLFCTNLEGKSYHIFNKAYSKEDYEKELSKYNFQIRENIAVAKNIFSSFLQEHPIPHIYSDTPQSVSGNYLKACSNTHLSYECFKSANLFVTSAIINGARCADGYGFANKTKDAVQFVSVGGNAKNIANSYECWNNVSDLQYSAYCSDSSNLFACIGLKGAEYCIFNKQYSKKDYQKKIKEIVSYLKKKNIWGQFFPRSFSPFSYNKSLANEYMPLSNVQVGLMGYNQRSKTKSSLNIKVLNQEFSIVPSTLTNNLDDLCNKNFLCEISATPFSFVKKELELYQKLSIPPPARSFEQRHVERLAHLSPKRTFSYQCSRSEKSIKTSFPEKWRQPVVERNHWLHLVGINSE